MNNDDLRYRLEMENDNEECYYFERLERVLATQVDTVDIVIRLIHHLDLSLFFVLKMLGCWGNLKVIIWRWWPNRDGKQSKWSRNLTAKGSKTSQEATLIRICLFPRVAVKRRFMFLKKELIRGYLLQFCRFSKRHQTWKVHWFLFTFKAYKNHWVLRTKPDDWFFPVIRRIASVVDDNALHPEVN